MASSAPIIYPANIKMSPSAIVINDGNVNSGIVVREVKLLNNASLWHKITVFTSETYPRDFILKTILDTVHPLDLIPVYFYAEPGSASFFARNCRMAIEKLCAQNLVVHNPSNKEKPFKLKIVLAFSNTKDLVINVQDNISKVLVKRYQSNNKMLNLDSFYKDPDLNEYCTLAQPKILYFVLHLSKQFAMHSLKLSNNDIHILGPLESLLSTKHLITLDLRNNMIEKMSELNILKTLQVKELFLDGNPLCDNYDEFSYIQAIRQVCPKIEKLDGVILGQKGFLPFRRNYLCKAEGQELIDQFLEHFFTLFDASNRSSLGELYAKNAMFSLTCNYLAGQASSASTILTPYKRVSRNIKMLSDLSKNKEFLMVGPKSIIDTFSFLPDTEHDPYSFTVDLVFYSVKLCIVIVTGAFREPTQALLDTEKIFGFSRTFVLSAKENNEYSILNDQLHISNATSAQQQRAFKVVRVPRNSQLKIEVPTTTKEKNDIVEAFKSITTLNAEWARKCLEECKYDLTKALLMFVDLHKIDRIPEEAFVS